MKMLKELNDEFAIEFKNMLVEYIFSENHKKFTGLNILTDYDFIVFSSMYPISIHIWDNSFIFSVHFNDNLQKLAISLKQPIDEIYYSMNYMRAEYSYSFDEDYNVYYSFAVTNLPEPDEIDIILCDLYDSMLIYDKLIKGWKETFL